jgi:tetratricopeptide (TPR) repeat protein
MNKAIALMYQNRLSEAGAMFALGLDVAVGADLPEAALRAYYNLADFRLMEGQVPEAGELIGRGLELARERGNRAWERDLLSQRVQVDLVSGQWDRLLSTAESLNVPGGEDSYRAAATALPFVFAARGEMAALEQLPGATRQQTEWAELGLMETMSQAIALGAVGRLDAAAERLESVRDLLEEVGSGSMAVFFLDSAEILLGAGRRDLVESLLGRPGIPPPLVASQLLQVRGMLSIDASELARAEEAYREAAALLRHIEAPFLLGRCLHHLAALLVRTGQGDETADLLHESNELFRRVGASAWLKRNAGLMPSEVAASG